MIKVILNDEEFKQYNNIEEAREDVIKFFDFVTSYTEKEKPIYKKFISDLKNCAIDDFNKLDYTVKFIDE